MRKILGKLASLFRPNGALLYAMSFLLENFKWLYERLKPAKDSKRQIYIIFDLPGQIKLYLSHDAIKKVIARLIK